MRIAVLGGGISSEHEVSLRSAESVAAGLRDAGHDVVGLDDQAALNALETAELTGTIVQRDDDAPQGEVVGQSPAAANSVRKGSTVTIFVSTGALVVPDQLGKTRRNAVTALKRAGFVVAVSEQPTDDPAQVGKVINQVPPGGSRGQRGDTVSIVVGAPPAPTP